MHLKFLCLFSVFFLHRHLFLLLALLFPSTTHLSTPTATSTVILLYVLLGVAQSSQIVQPGSAVAVVTSHTFAGLVVKSIEKSPLHLVTCKNSAQYVIPMWCFSYVCASKEQYDQNMLLSIKLNLYKRCSIYLFSVCYFAKMPWQNCSCLTAHYCAI